MLDLESMIKHCKEVAKEQAELYECYMQHGEQGDYVNECLKCAEEHRQLAEWLKELKQLRGQRCDDAISRQAVEEITWEDPSYTDSLNVLAEVRDKVRELPPVTPQPKVGRWIIIDDCERFIAECSECGEVVDSRMVNKYPYCHCGAKMMEDKSENKESNM